MEGLIVLTVITLLLADFCAMAYLSRLALRIIFKLIDRMDFPEEK